MPDRCRRLRRRRRGRRRRFGSRLRIGRLRTVVCVSTSFPFSFSFFPELGEASGEETEKTHVGNADQAGENHGCDPGNTVVRTERCPSEAEEADGFERCEEEEPPEADFGL